MCHLNLHIKFVDCSLKSILYDPSEPVIILHFSYFFYCFQDTQTLSTLLKHGKGQINLNHKQSFDGDGLSALTMAVQQMNIATLRTLLTETEKNTLRYNKRHNGDYPLHIAMQRKTPESHEIVRLLMNNLWKFDLPDEMSISRYNYNTLSEKVAVLISLKNKADKTVLDIAIADNKVEYVEWILDAVDEIEGFKGQNYLEKAIKACKTKTRNLQGAKTILKVMRCIFF